MTFRALRHAVSAAVSGRHRSPCASTRGHAPSAWGRTPRRFSWGSAGSRRSISTSLWRAAPSTGRLTGSAPVTHAIRSRSGMRPCRFRADAERRSSAGGRAQIAQIGMPWLTIRKNASATQADISRGLSAVPSGSRRSPGQRTVGHARLRPLGEARYARTRWARGCPTCNRARMARAPTGRLRGELAGWRRNGVPVVQRRSWSPPTAGAQLLSGVSRCYRRRWAMSIDRWARR